MGECKMRDKNSKFCKSGFYQTLFCVGRGEPTRHTYCLSEDDMPPLVFDIQEAYTAKVLGHLEGKSDE